MKSCDNCKNYNADGPFPEVCMACRWVYENGERVPDNWEPKVLTMADRIRAMSDEELAKMLANEIPHGDCYGCDLNCASFVGDKFLDSCEQAWYMWLKKLVEVE